MHHARPALHVTPADRAATEGSCGARHPRPIRRARPGSIWGLEALPYYSELAERLAKQRDPDRRGRTMRAGFEITAVVARRGVSGQWVRPIDAAAVVERSGGRPCW